MFKLILIAINIFFNIKSKLILINFKIKLNLKA